MRPVALDLFCGAGGAAMGLHRAGFDVVGVDIKPQPRYPFAFVEADALTFDLTGFDFIWASPPCQAYSFASAKHRNRGKEYPDLLPAMADRIREHAYIPYVIENVVGAGRHLLAPVTLCGSMFGLGVRRHRLFESNFHIAPLRCIDCSAKGGLTDVTGHGPPRRWYRSCTVAGHGGDGPSFSYGVWKDAMGIHWMTKQELTQAIPPAYSEYIASQWLRGRSNL